MSHTYANIERLIQNTIGLDIETIGGYSFDRAIQDRLLACGINDEEKYLNLLNESPIELQTIIEALVVRETWFYREPEMFQSTIGIIKAWLEKHPTGIFRILSMPCSTGEEPYTIAIALLNENIPSHRFTIDAYDVSEQALFIARNGIYGKNSFRGITDQSFFRYFKQDGNHFQINDDVKNTVKFYQANIFASNLKIDDDRYNIIFCRNVLIYFEQSRKKQCINMLARKLKSDGHLFLASAETFILKDSQFSLSAFPRAYKIKVNASATSSMKVAAPAIRATPTLQTTKEIPGIKNIDSYIEKIEAKQQSYLALTIQDAQQLADLGQLDQAETICLSLLANEYSSIEIYNLLGLIADAKNQPNKAVEYYKKVLYLNPNHYEALLHLIYFHEQQNDLSGANLLRARLIRQQECGEAK